MTDNTQPEALRALAEAAKWTGKWYDAGCNTVYCTYDKEDSILHDEIAHPVPFGVSGYIAAAHPQAVIALLARIAELESELEAVGAGGVSGPLMGRTAPPTAQAEGWTKASKQLPPCREDQLYIGINTAGFAGVFNAVRVVNGNTYCLMEVAEESVSIMSDLAIWKPFNPPTSAEGVEP